jgi:hypothetical protein
MATWKDENNENPASSGDYICLATWDGEVYKLTFCEYCIKRGWLTPSIEHIYWQPNPTPPEGIKIEP